MMCSALVNNVLLLSQEIKRLKAENKRFIIAIAGPPASGKSTLADALVDYLNDQVLSDRSAALLPMDGFHLDNEVLLKKGLLARKGAPETYDANGFCSLVESLRDSTEDLFYPLFDRTLDMAIAGSGVIKQNTSVVVVEGNYLLLKSQPWDSLLTTFDHTVFISPSIDVLEQRLIERWQNYGFDKQTAETRARNNDLVNANLVLEQSSEADIRFEETIRSIENV